MTKTIYENGTELDQIIKEELMKNIQIVDEADGDGKAAKVYKKIGGLTNIGRTYFVNQGEVDRADDWAQNQMAQKYGAEIYGISSQQANQRSNGTASSTGTGSAQTSSLISCKCNTFLVVPGEGFKESSGGGGYNQFKDAWNNFDSWVKGKDKDWHDKHDGKGLNKAGAFGGDGIIELKKGFRQIAGGKDENNKKIWKQIEDIFKQDPWDSDYKSDKEFKKIVDDLSNGYKSWCAGEGGKLKGNKDPSEAGADETGWNPNLTFRIDVQTNFGEDWFKRKFKSGLLNKAIMTIKTSAMSKAVTQDEYKGHKYTADEMLPQDKRKLDSLQWKMTNKVAKDYITFLLGWSRKKEKYSDIEAARDPSPDPGFGKSMAKKALGNRGIWGRLKQKLFAGQQSNNVISVVFQLADPNDGTWKLIEKEKEPKTQTDKEGGSESGGETGGEATSESFDTNFGFNPNRTLKLTSEDCSFESDRYRLVREVCCGDDTNIVKLVDNCIIGHKYK